ncbi:hypothetical protein [Actinokineospora sp. NPDC004072]
MRETVAAVRGRVSDRIARLIDFRIDLAVGHRIAEHDRRADEHARRIDEHERRLAEVERLHGWTAGEVERMIPQIAAIEARMAGIDDLLAGVPAGAPEEVAQARSLIEEIRREHAQIRVRLTGIAQYEERLGSLEDRLA